MTATDTRNAAIAALRAIASDETADDAVRVHAAEAILNFVREDA